MLFWTIMASLLLMVQVSPPAPRTPVLVELFTSEGCSSCPPADRLLMELARQPVQGADIIVMSEHVDYWDYQGWKDPFSSTQFTDRQNVYAKKFVGGNGAYTPQMVVDGRSEFVGSDRSQAIAEISRASRTPKPAISAVARSSGASEVLVEIRIEGVAEPADVYLAITENNLSSNVARGENQGHKLAHTAVVRKLELIGRSPAAGSFSSDRSVRLARDWKRDDLHVVVFVQSNKTRNVLGVSSADFTSH